MPAKGTKPIPSEKPIFASSFGLWRVSSCWAIRPSLDFRAPEHIEVDGVCGTLVFEVAQSMRGRHYHRKLLIGKEFPEPRNGLGRAHLPQSRRRSDANFRLGIIERMPGEVAGVNVVAQQAEGSDAIRPLAGFPRRSRGVQHVPGFLGAGFAIVSGLQTEGQQSSPGKTGNR